MQSPHHATPPDRFAAPAGSGDGRIRRSVELLGRSWRFLRQHPALLTLPAMAAAGTVLAALLIFAPIVMLTPQSWDTRVAIGLAAVITALPFTFISAFVNVGFLGMVTAYRRGEAPTMGDGLRFARTRWRAIAAWSLIATLVGTALAALQQLPVVGEWLGRLIGWLGGLAWSLATFFVVPVLVVENVGARAAIRRSAQVFKARWGESVTGNLVIGSALGLLVIPVMILGGAGFALYPDHLVTGGALMLAALTALAALLAISSALTQLFQLSLYEHATNGAVSAPFTEADMRSAMKERSTRFWRR